MITKYTPTIGIECHVQFNTVTKLFSAVANDAREAPVNTLVSHIDFGLPGALPVLNERAIELVSRAAFALNTAPQKFSKFDRKHYFYPDLPMGYQITQYEEPIILGGYVTIESGGKHKKIGITRAHLEADAGKSVHPPGADYSLVDLNRAGTPLLEIVSEPDMSSAEEAKAYAHELYLLMRYADVSDANLYYGNMRFDVNVSVSKTSTFGTRTETKNINSFRAVEKVVEFEIKRQIELLDRGQKVIQETRGWNDDSQKTFLQRTKENAEDYRYMPDPDLPPLVLSASYIDKIKPQMSLMPHEWRDRLSKLGLTVDQREVLLDGEVENENISYLPIIESNIKDKNLAKFMANWFVNLEIPLRKEDKIKGKIKDAEREDIYRAAFELYSSGQLSSTNLKTLLGDLLSSDILPADIKTYAQDKNLLQVSDTSKLEELVKRVIKDNPQAASDIKNGETKAIGFLTGQVMKLSKGQANPSLVQKIIKRVLVVTAV